MHNGYISNILVALTILPAAAAPVSYFSGHIKSESDLSELKATGLIGAVNFSTSPIRSGDFNAANPNPSVTLNGIAFSPAEGAGTEGITGAVGEVSYSIGGFVNTTLEASNNIGFDINRQSGVDYATSPLLYGLAYDVIRTSGNNIMMSAAFSNLIPNQAYSIQFVFSSGDPQRRLYLDNDTASTGDAATAILNYGVTDGVGVLTATFTADETGSQSFQFFNTNAGSQRVSLAGFTVAKVASSYSVALDQNHFVSGAKKGTEIGVLTGYAPGAEPDATTFTLVSGEGSTDNSLFQIDGDRLEVGNHDFTGDSETGETIYSVRVRAKNGGSPALEGERTLSIVMSEDDDLDDLPDGWERSFGNDLSLLSGLNGHDQDGDGITDLEEYQFSLSYPGLSPILADSDGDGLNDYDELYAYFTDPVKVDTDSDGATDGQEVAANTYPTEWDSDGDGWRDGVEIARGTNPLDPASRPTYPSSVAIGLLTDDASTGISTSKIYTHAVSGGAAATVNGVNFAELTTTTAPANFAWDISADAGPKGIIVNNNGNWTPAQGGVTGPGLLSLLGSFVYPSGKAPGCYETFTLSGLTPGRSYEVRLYLRTWGPTGTGRPIDISFNNGTETVVPFSAILLDRPDITFGGDPNVAYYVSYRYVAQGTEMNIRGTIPDTEIQSNPATGGMHLYGLSNEQLGATPADLKATSVSRSAAGEILIEFTGAATQSYRVTKSASPAGPFVPLTLPLSVTTDATGAGHVVIPASEASESREFYRVEE